MYHFATSLTLFLTIFPSAFSLFLKTHLVPTMFWFTGLETRVHTWFLSICSSSSCMAFTHDSYFKASWMSFGSICEMNAIWSSCGTCLNEDLVLVPSWRFPKIFSIEWFLEYLRFLKLEGSSGCVTSAVDPWRCCSFSWFSSSDLVFEGSSSES